MPASLRNAPVTKSDMGLSCPPETHAAPNDTEPCSAPRPLAASPDTDETACAMAQCRPPARIQCVVCGPMAAYVTPWLVGRAPGYRDLHLPRPLDGFRHSSLLARGSVYHNAFGGARSIALNRTQLRLNRRYISNYTSYEWGNEQCTRLIRGASFVSDSYARTRRPRHSPQTSDSRSTRTARLTDGAPRHGRRVPQAGHVRRGRPALNL